MSLSHDEIRHQSADGFWVCWDKSPVKVSAEMQRIVDEHVAKLEAIIAGKAVR